MVVHFIHTVTCNLCLYYVKTTRIAGYFRTDLIFRTATACRKLNLRKCELTKNNNTVHFPHRSPHGRAEEMSIEKYLKHLRTPKRIHKVACRSLLRPRGLGS